MVRSLTELVLDAEVEAVPQARRFAAQALADEPVDVVDAAELIITELMTNAALHGRGPVILRIRGAGTRVRVEVQDTGAGLPMIPAQSTDAMTGRGLRLVAALSASWGVVPVGGGGKVVWAELAPDGGVNDQDVPEIDVDALLAAWEDDEPAEPHFTVRLGAVPTDLLLSAKAHIDNVVREARLAEGAHDAADISPELSALIETVTRGFASARAEIKRQALAAASRGDAETELVLTQPASAAVAGEKYLAALDVADRFARHAQLLTLEPPPVHKLFRRWYVQALVDQLRARAAGVEAPAPATFLQVLAAEVGSIAPLRDAAQRLEMLQTIASQLTTAGTVEEIASVVVSNATSFLGAVAGRVFVVDGDVLRSVAVHGGTTDGVDHFQQIPLDADLPGPEALRTGRPVVLRNRAHLQERFPALARVSPADRTMHVAPLVIGDHALGVLSLSFPVDGRLDAEAQASFVQALADALAQALERAVAIEAAQVANERLSFLAEASVALSSSLEYAETASAVGDLLVPRLADWFVLQVLEGDELATIGLKHYDPGKLAWAERMSGLYPVNMDAPTGAANVIRTGRSELYPEVPPELVEASAVSDEHLDVIRQLGIRSGVVVPLAGRSGIFGAITLIYAESGRHYDERDMAFAEDIARRAALALENARVFREQSGRLASVTRVAEAAQHAILAPPPARIGAVALSARYVSAAAEALVGGDLYEVVARPGAVRLLIGDVRGKGLAAVRTATVVLGEFRAAAAEVDDLAEVARQIDRRVRAYLSDEDFITALVAEVADDGSFTVAAHLPAGEAA